MNGRSCSYELKGPDTASCARLASLLTDASAPRCSAARRHLQHRRRHAPCVKVNGSAERGLGVHGPSGREDGARRSSTALHSLATPTHPAEPQISESTGSAPGYDIREAHQKEYWKVADVHCMSFYPSVQPPMLHFLRLDRVLALHLGRMIEDNRKETNGKYRCVVAAAPSPRRTAAYTLARWWDSFSGYDWPAEEDNGDIYAAIVVDTLAQYIPKRLQSSGTQARKAYISNLAVSGKLRRQGLAKAVLQKAEAMASKWTCDEIFLHCDPKNTAAYNLYVQAGYTVLDGQEERASQPRQDVKLVLMQKCVDPLLCLADNTVA